LGVMRSLYHMKVPVCLLEDEVSIGRFSKCKKFYFKTPPVTSEIAYLNFLKRLAEGGGFREWVIFANNDETVFFLSKFKQDLSPYFKIPTPHWEVTKYSFEKKLTYQLAEKISIPIPKTRFFDTKETLSDLNLNYPIVVKPSIKINFKRETKKKALKARNRAELNKHYEFITRYIPPSEVIFQEMIPGGAQNLYSFGALFKNGKALARIIAHRQRQHPIEFGNATTFAVSTNIPLLEEMGTKILKEMNYYGLAEVEFMYDPRDETYKLLEINPRVWGWHTLALAAGVNLPYLIYQDILGEEVGLDGFKIGVKWARLVTDTPLLLKEFLKGNIGIGDYIAYLKEIDEFAVWSKGDPLPFFTELALLPYLWKKKGY